VSVSVGIDVGATLCKIAVRHRSLATEHHPSVDLGPVRTRLEALGPSRVVATGGGAVELGPSVAGVPIEHVSEFEAWGRGAPLVAATEGVTLPRHYLLVSLGTGTSVLDVDDGQVMRVGGTALGGGTVLGLGRLLLGVDAFPHLVNLARRGDRRRVDLLVSDVYRGTVPALAHDLTASSFAKLESTRPEDLAHALMGLVGENVALICGALARGADVEAVVYCGSTLDGNDPLQSVVGEITQRFGHRPVFLSGGAYCGAIGAAVVAENGR
jgi:type II pantothenate kinase